MNSIKSILYVMLIFVFFSCKEENGSTIFESSSVENEAFNYLPTNTAGAVYDSKTYTFSYSEKHEQAEWVAYILNPSDIIKANYKRPYFEVDKKVITGAAHWKNYKKSGYNKGHLCPAADRRASFSDYEDTFLTSNISPQKYDFNAGVWNRLEQKVRYWATKYDGLYVVTGGILTDSLNTIGYERVAVPNYFYKILMTKDKQRMIAFLLPHEESNAPLYTFVTSVDVIEKLSGVDFYPVLEDNQENILEAKTDYKGWSF